MAERSVKVRLSAVVDDFKRNMGEAAKATGQVGDAAQDAEKKSSRLGDAAKGAGKVAVTALGVAATATAALGVAALKTGVQYNSLEQTSRAALTTLLGSAEAASVQMEKLTEFGRTSPFPRQVWIEAQNQLIGFGMEADRVIPTLSAINDAMSALGGSPQAISEVVRVLAQIQSTGQVTAGSLNQLAIRGIDAATLIGNAFGKSAGQIRDEVSSGAIDAGTFLTVLVDQMTATYSGAADLVRQTWEGATDRIKGAFRDIGSILAAPFIDPQGGGAAVDWANALADSLRALEGVLGPVVADLAGRAGPAFQSITDALERAAKAMRDADIDNIIAQLERFAPAVAGLGAAGLAAAAGGLPGVLGRLGRVLVPGGPLVAGLSAFVLAVPEARDVLRRLLDAVAPLGQPLLDLAVALADALTPAVEAVVKIIEPLLPLLEGAARLTAEFLEAVNTSIDTEPLDRHTSSLEDNRSVLDKLYDLVQDFNMAGGDAAQYVTDWEESVAGWNRTGFDWIDRLKEVLGVTDEVAVSSDVAAGRFGAVAGAAAGMNPVLANTAAELGGVAEQTSAATEELEAYLDMVRRATDPVYALHGALRDVEDAQDALNEAVKEHGPASREAQDAAVVLAQKLDSLEAAALNGDISFEEFDARLQQWVRQSKITQDEADILRGRVRELTSEVEGFEGDYSAHIELTGVSNSLAEIESIRRRLAAIPRSVSVSITALTSSVHTPTFGVTRASGGPVVGPGTATSDSVPAWLSDGEFVVRASAVDRYGLRMLDAINRERFAGGGPVSSTYVKPAAVHMASGGRVSAPGHAAVTAPGSSGGSQVLELRVSGSGSLYEQIKAGARKGEIGFIDSDGRRVQVQ